MKSKTQTHVRSVNGANLTQQHYATQQNNISKQLKPQITIETPTR